MDTAKAAAQADYAARIRSALTAVEVGVKPECGHPFCGDKCGTATPAQDCREHSGIARMKEVM